MPYHKLLDGLEEDRLAGKAYGSTRRGISPVYSDKYMKKAFRMGDLLDDKAINDRLAGVSNGRTSPLKRATALLPSRKRTFAHGLRSTAACSRITSATQRNT